MQTIIKIFLLTIFFVSISSSQWKELIKSVKPNEEILYISYNPETIKKNNDGSFNVWLKYETYHEQELTDYYINYKEINIINGFVKTYKVVEYDKYGEVLNNVSFDIPEKDYIVPNSNIEQVIKNIFIHHPKLRTTNNEPQTKN